MIAGNWKMNKTNAEAVPLASDLKRELANVTAVDLVICPPFIALKEVAGVLAGSNIAIGAQNMYWESFGAFTGEINAPMLREVGCQYVLIGHSERRQFFGETNETVNKRVNAALANGLRPIVCVGETLAQRDGGQVEEVLTEQVTQGLAGLTTEQMRSMTMAYEPVWAIGTGRTATSTQAQEAHGIIRGLLKKMFSVEVGDKTRIQYGGSVKGDNAQELMSQPDVDGALVGGASLKVQSFVEIVRNSL
jgi:triosephosphate isomerase